MTKSDGPCLSLLVSEVWLPHLPHPHSLGRQESVSLSCLKDFEGTWEILPRFKTDGSSNSRNAVVEETWPKTQELR